MRPNERERYRQILTDIVQTYPGRPPATEDLGLHADVNDLAVVNHARYISDRKEQILTGMREAARRALARLDDGEFGLCVECGEPISPKRLMAVPWTDCCVACQTQRERQQLRQAA